jgi:hypothetical protein
MNFKERKDQITRWAKENKGKILIGLGTITGLVIATVVVNRPKSEHEIEGEKILETLQNNEEDDYGKDLEMHFVDPETKEVLWKERCTESYMNDFKEIGMEYEETRKLNGLEE